LSTIRQIANAPFGRGCGAQSANSYDPLMPSQLAAACAHALN